MFWSISVGRKEWKIDIGRSGAGEFLFRFFGFIFDALHSGSIVFDIDAGFFFEFVDEEVDQNVIEIFTTEVSIAIGGQYFENTIADIHDADIEGATTEIKDGDFFIFFAFEAVGKSSCGWFVDNTFNF